MPLWHVYGTPAPVSNINTVSPTVFSSLHFKAIIGNISQPVVHEESASQIMARYRHCHRHPFELLRQCKPFYPPLPFKTLPSWAKSRSSSSPPDPSLTSLDLLQGELFTQLKKPSSCPTILASASTVPLSRPKPTISTLDTIWNWAWSRAISESIALFKLFLLQRHVPKPRPWHLVQWVIFNRLPKELQQHQTQLEEEKEDRMTSERIRAAIGDLSIEFSSLCDRVLKRWAAPRHLFKWSTLSELYSILSWSLTFDYNDLEAIMMHDSPRYRAKLPISMNIYRIGNCRRALRMLECASVENSVSILRIE